MKLRNREINIFSMSALDLFASALGAFMLLAIVALPFFPNTGDSPQLIEEVQAEMSEQLDQMSQQMETVTDQLSQAQTDLAMCQADAQNGPELILTEVQTELESCRALLEQTFALVVISWPSNDDVDLYVIDPLGNEYSYAARTFPGSDAALEEDNTQGPGNEIWLSPTALEGDYEVYFDMFSKRDQEPVSVRASILHKDGRILLPDTSLSMTGEKPLIVTFNVDDQGNVSLR
tara:strand:- start:1449 stop:2147 length:699 start_codon:yes stop_codon:yes gene_type:complete